MAAQPCVSLDVVRASLGCLLLLSQTRAAFNALPSGSQGWGNLLGNDWYFATALACHVGWFLACVLKGWSSRPFCCASRVAPKVALLAQLFAQHRVPATAAWMKAVCDKRYKWCWKAMAEIFVYTCGEFPSAVMLRSSVLDVVCTVVIWARVYVLTDVRPTPTAAVAHVLLRLALSLIVHYCQRRAYFVWARKLCTSRRQYAERERLAAKTTITYNIRSHAPVCSSILYCNNPAILSHIAAASGKDLEPVRLERLSPGGIGNIGAVTQQPASPAAAAAGDGPSPAGAACGTEAYDLARRLVSSAGAGGGGASGSNGSADGGGYTSAARKVRVSVKIPDRSPEDLAPGWDTDLHINGQRRAVVLFTYIRRGCIQLVVDLFCPVPVAGAAAMAAAAPLPPPPALSTAAADRHCLGDAAERGSEEACGGRDAAGSGAGGLGFAGPSSHLGRGRLVVAVTTRHVPARVERDGGAAIPCGLESGLGMGAEETAEPPTGGDAGALPAGTAPPEQAADGGGGGAHGQLLLRAICSEALFAGRTLTVQVGATASLVRVQAQPAGATGDAAASGCGSDFGLVPAVVGPAPPLPGDVSVLQQVVCTSGGSGWSALRAAAGLWPLRRRHHPPSRPRAVVLACTWDARDDGVGTTGAGSPGVRARGLGPGPGPGAELQLTVRQQGRFLPVARVEPGGYGSGGRVADSERCPLQLALAEGNVAVAVGPGSSSASRACLLAFTPASGDGLAQVELSRGGCHSARAATVLLVSCAAVAYELEQLQAAAVVGLDGGAAPRPSAVADVVRDFGCFLDIVPALAACCYGGGGSDVVADGGDSCSSSILPLIEWSLGAEGDSGPCVPVPARMVFLRPRPGCEADGAAAAACDGCAATRGRNLPPAAPPAHALGAAARATADDDEGDDRYLERRALTLSALGCRLGLNLLRYFLSSGMTACAMRVLGVLTHQLGVPPALLACEACCAERMTLLHHAARSGSFRTLAALAAWLEERGVDPGWERACRGGVTPLHLLAVVPDSEAACALLQLRWPAARCAWRGAASAAGATPAQFAAMVRRGATAPAALRPWWERAAGAAPAAWAVGGAWRCAAAARQRLVRRALVRGCVDAAAPALGFMLPPLESLYCEWSSGRGALMEHIFLGIYAAYCVSLAVKGGRALLSGHCPGLLLLAARLGLLALRSPLWQALQQWRRRRPLRLVPSQGLAVHSSKEGREESGGSDAATGFGGGSGSGDLWLLTSSEGAAIAMELLRLVVMLLIATGAMRLPYTWVRLVQLRLDVLYNAIMRPMGSQMRVLPGLVSAAIALIGETVVLVAIWRPCKSAALAFVLALARGLFTHGLGLCVTVLLQAAARGRFLAELRGLRSGLPGSKAG